MLAALFLLAAGTGAAPAPAPLTRVPAFAPRPDAVYRLRISGETGSLLEFRNDPGLDARALDALERSLRLDGERRLRFDFEFEERWVPVAAGWRVERRARRGSVVRTVAGQPEPGPLPIDYEGLEVVVEIAGDGTTGPLRLASSRLGEDEREILAQFFALEPLPAQPGGDCAFALTRGTGAPWYRITDDYATAPSAPGSPLACDAGRLQLDRAVAIPADLVAGTPELATAAPARFAVRLGCDGLPSEVSGEFELGFTETMEAPPELRARTKQAAAARPAPPPQIRINYRLPTRIRVERDGAAQGACP